LRDELARNQQARDGMRDAAGALQGDVDRMVSLLEVAVHAIGDLGNSTTVAELLAALVNRLATQFTRVALFRLKGNRLEGEHQAGFDGPTDVAKLVIPLSVDSLLTRVAASGAPERLSGAEVAARAATPFAGAPAATIAFPLLLQGETFAVVYADRAEAPTPGADDAGVAFAKLLAA